MSLTSGEGIEDRLNELEDNIELLKFGINKLRADTVKVFDAQKETMDRILDWAKVIEKLSEEQGKQIIRLTQNQQKIINGLKKK